MTELKSYVAVMAAAKKEMAETLDMASFIACPMEIGAGIMGTVYF